MAQKVLVVDDEPKMVRLVQDYLEKAHFQVVRAYNGREALAAFRREKPALIVLDLMLPNMDGLDVMRILRQESNVPVIMLTARVEESDRVLGLELGADDYVTKPFSPRELVARVRAVLRRMAESEPTRSIIRAGDIELDLARRVAKVAGRAVELTTTEFNLLLVLARHPGWVFSRLDLLTRTCGAYQADERTINAHIKNLRRKIEPVPKKPRYILTVYRAGYKLVEE